MIKSSVASFLAGALTICFIRKWFVKLVVLKRLKSPQLMRAQLGSRASTLVKEFLCLTFVNVSIYLID